MTDGFIPPPPPPQRSDIVVSREVGYSRHEPGTTIVHDEHGHAVPRGWVPEDAERSRRAAEEAGVVWVEGMNPYAVGGPYWSPPRSPEDYPVVEGIEVCDDCGYQHVTHRGNRSCNAHRKVGTTKYPCRNPPSRELTICLMHGAKGSARKGQARRLAEKHAKKSLAKVKVRPVGNAIDELADLAAEALAVKDHFANVVAELKDQYRFVDDKNAEQLDARVALYERALDRSHKFLNDLAKAGFEEQRIRLDERKAAIAREYIVGVLSQLGHDIMMPEVRAALEEWAPVLDGHPRGTILELEEVTDDDDDAPDGDDGR